MKPIVLTTAHEDRARIAAGENRADVLEEAERMNPRAHRKHWQYAETSL